MSYVTGRQDDDRSMNFLIKAQEHKAIQTRPVARAWCAEDSHSSGLFGLAGGAAYGKPEPDPGHGLTALI